VEGGEKPQLEQAEAEGKSHSKGEDPAQKQLGDFVTTVLGKVNLPTALGQPNLLFYVDEKTRLAGLADKSIFNESVTLGVVTFPYARAKLSSHHSVTVRQPVTHMLATVDSIKTQLLSGQGQSLEDMLKNATPATAQTIEDLLNKPDKAPPKTVPCNDLITATAAALSVDLTSEKCTFALQDLSECLTALKRTLADDWKGVKETDDCKIDRARDVVMAFQPVVQTEIFRTSGSSTVMNQPLQRYSFGLATGFVGAISSDADHPRAQIQAGKIAANPFSRSLSLGVVNLPLWGYDTTTPEMTMRERVKPFVGVAFAPYFGTAVGISYGFSRYIGVQVGIGQLWYDTPKDTEKIDEPPKDKAAPFRLGSSTAWFIAAAYNLGGK
jgi:hypothetical protein